MSGSTPVLVLDGDGETWEAWFQGPVSPAYDLIRFYGPLGNLRYGGIDKETWADQTEESLFSCLEHSWVPRKTSPSSESEVSNKLTPPMR
jgi:hypothetical protein